MVVAQQRLLVASTSVNIVIFGSEYSHIAAIPSTSIVVRAIRIPRGVHEYYYLRPPNGRRGTAIRISQTSRQALICGHQSHIYPSCEERTLKSGTHPTTTCSDCGN